MRSSVLCPTEPVAPSTLTRFTAPPRPLLRPAAERTRADRSLFGTAALAPISIPQQQRACRRMHVENEPGQAGGGRRHHQPVNSIHYATMARYQCARVLGAKAALDPRFHKIAHLRQKGED